MHLVRWWKAMKPNGTSRHRLVRNAVLTLIAICFILGVLWRFTGLRHRINFHTLVQWLRVIQGHPWTPVGVVIVFVVGGLLFFFHALLLWVTIFTFDPIHA